MPLGEMQQSEVAERNSYNSEVLRRKVGEVGG